MKRVRSLCILGMLLAGCNSPLHTEPFLNGQLEVGLTTCPVDGPCDFQPATLSVQAIDVQSNSYAFRGTLEGDPERFLLEGDERAGVVSGTLIDQDGNPYNLLGRVTHGSEGTASLRQNNPAARLTARCNERLCAHGSIDITIGEQDNP